LKGEGRKKGRSDLTGGSGKGNRKGVALGVRKREREGGRTTRKTTGKITCFSSLLTLNGGLKKGTVSEDDGGRNRGGGKKGKTPDKENLPLEDGGYKTSQLQNAGEIEKRNEHRMVMIRTPLEVKSSSRTRDVVNTGLLGRAVTFIVRGGGTRRKKYAGHCGRRRSGGAASRQMASRGGRNGGIVLFRNLKGGALGRGNVWREGGNSWLITGEGDLSWGKDQGGEAMEGHSEMLQKTLPRKRGGFDHLLTNTLSITGGARRGGGKAEENWGHLAAEGPARGGWRFLV